VEGYLREDSQHHREVIRQISGKNKKLFAVLVGGKLFVFTDE
jgi:hypothetical protein